MISDGRWGILSFDERQRLTPEEFVEYLNYRWWLRIRQPVDVFHEIPTDWVVYRGGTLYVRQDVLLPDPDLEVRP